MQNFKKYNQIRIFRVNILLITLFKCILLTCRNLKESLLKDKEEKEKLNAMLINEKEMIIRKSVNLKTSANNNKYDIISSTTNSINNNSNNLNLHSSISCNIDNLNSNIDDLYLNKNKSSNVFDNNDNQIDIDIYRKSLNKFANDNSSNKNFNKKSNNNILNKNDVYYNNSLNEEEEKSKNFKDDNIQYYKGIIFIYYL